MNKRSLAAMILIIALMITSPGLNNAAERSISGKEKLETLKGKEETLATASDLGTSSNAAEKNQKILSLVIPQKLEIIIDPLEVDGRTQVYSEKYRIKNTGKTKGILQLSKLICKPGKSRHVEVRKNQEDIHVGKEKAIYLEMVLEYEELKENLNLQSEKHLVLSQEEASYEQTLEAGEEVILSFWGEVNEYASEPWEDKDVEITVLYSWKEMPEEPEEETEEEESPEVLKTAEEAEDDGLTELEKEETEPEESLEENVEESTGKNATENSAENSEKNLENIDENSEAIEEGLEETGGGSEESKEEPKESLERSEGSSEETKEELKETEESSSINPTERTEESAEIPSQAEEKVDGTDREHQKTDAVETDKNTEEDKENSSAVDAGNSNEKESSSSGKLESDADKEKDMDKDRGTEDRDEKESRPEAETAIKDRDESSTPDKIENKSNEEGDSSLKAERDEHVNDVHKVEDTENLDKDEIGSP